MAENDDRISSTWQQFLTAKRALLAEFDQARTHAMAQPVATHHGVVGEAAVRNWLSTFLPKRYGVVPGYIKSQDPFTSHTSQFDVIIYDQIEAPILWIETNKDKSDDGRMRIVPAEFVRAVIEVKSAFNRKTVREASEKLMELMPLMAKVDDPRDNYPKYLPNSAVLSMLFFDLKLLDKSDFQALDLIRDIDFPRPFHGPIILRGEGLRPDDTCLIKKLRSANPIPEIKIEGGLLRGATISSSVDAANGYASAMLMWNDVHFSDFAFDLLALLNGSYRAGYASSFHGLQLQRASET